MSSWDKNQISLWPLQDEWDHEDLSRSSYQCHQSLEVGADYPQKPHWTSAMGNYFFGRNIPYIGSICSRKAAIISGSVI